MVTPPILCVVRVELVLLPGATSSVLAMKEIPTDSITSKWVCRKVKTIPEVLGQVGYTSGVIGKWYLGAHISNHPLNRGFNFFMTLGEDIAIFPKIDHEDSYSINDEPLVTRRGSCEIISQKKPMNI